MSTQSWVSKIQSLPVLPQVAMRVTERMQSSTATLTEISDLIKSDLGLSTKVLRLANSSYYSIPGGVADVSKALHYLGFTTIAQIVLTSSVFGAFKTQGASAFPLTQFWTHTFAVGLLSEIAARSLGFKNPSDAFMGGLMHDVGKFILLELAPDQLVKIVRMAQETPCSFIEAEEKLGGAKHTELGAELAKHWGLPQSLTKTIFAHHTDTQDRDTLVVQWADHWINFHKIGMSGNFDPQMETHLTALSKKLGLSGSALKSIETHFQKDFEKAGAILSGH